MEDMCASQEGQEALSKMKVLTYGGAPMAHATGEKVASLLKLQTIFGSSETAYTPSLLFADPANWDYLDGIRHLNTKWKMLAMEFGSWCFHDLPHATIMPSSTPSPTYKNTAQEIYSYPTHPSPAALLIEPEWDNLEENWSPDQFVQEIQTVLTEANELLPAYGKIFDSHIAFASRDKPFALSPKGSLRRRMIFSDYSDAIDELYEPENIPKPVIEISPDNHEELKGSSMDNIQCWIQHEVTLILRLDTVGLDEDLSNIGMDSLQAIRLTQILRKGLESQRNSESQALQYTYSLPTIRKLAEKFDQQINGNQISEKVADPVAWPREDQLARTIWEHSLFLSSKGFTVALTGSTGELGSYLLNSLLKNTSIEQIYYLNRSEDAKSRQISSFRAKGLPHVWITETSRIHFWHANFEQENLGSTSPQYKFLQENVDRIIHNAWPVNFNKTLESFEPQLIGVTNLLRLVEESPRASFHFVSSVAADTYYGEKMMDRKNDICEAPKYSGSQALPYGYAESKFVAEGLCELSVKHSGSRVVIYRVGQLGGPSTMKGEMWNPRDWFPSLVRSSKTMKILPDSLGLISVDWLPIDTAAQVMAELIDGHFEKKKTKRAELAQYYEVYNSHATDWSTLAPLVARACDAKIVPLDKWVRRLESQAANLLVNSETLRNLPALSVLSFFRLMASSRDRSHAEYSVYPYSSAKSNTLGSIKAVDTKLMELWLIQLKEWIPDLIV
ncbi:NRPS-like enzyme [Penicillium malachiteum]|nr:NRPS-like enzyme [Penicillium malachiteum]